MFATTPVSTFGKIPRPDRQPAETVVYCYRQALQAQTSKYCKGLKAHLSNMAEVSYTKKCTSTSCYWPLYRLPYQPGSPNSQEHPEPPVGQWTTTSSGRREAVGLPFLFIFVMGARIKTPCNGNTKELYEIPIKGLGVA